MNDAGEEKTQTINHIRMGKATLIIAIILMILTVVMTTLFFTLGSRITLGVFYGYIGFMFVVSITSLVLSSNVKHTEIGKKAFILNWVAFALFMVTLIVTIIILIVAASKLGDLNFT